MLTLEMPRRVWDSVNEITDEQFLADDAYSRGSIRNLMVHLFSTDGRAIALQQLNEFGIETFPQDFVI